MFIIKLLSQHVSGITVPIFRRTRLCTTACGVSKSKFHRVHTACDPAPHNHSQHNQCRTPHAVVYSTVLLKIDIMMPETCWNGSLITNIRLVASCWLLSLHPAFTMHGHKSLKFPFYLIFTFLTITCRLTSVHNELPLRLITHQSLGMHSIINSTYFLSININF